ncbi:MAG: hypothetical protein HUU54_00610 [Ignavibacteriaceae bacterium]|nr:hypothetical protein [Ignavibacteriaceae bacterium]
MSEENHKVPGQDSWDIKNGDYQRSSYISNKRILQNRRKRMVRSVLWLLIAVTLITLMSYYLIENFYTHE